MRDFAITWALPALAGSLWGLSTEQVIQYLYPERGHLALSLPIAFIGAWLIGGRVVIPLQNWLRG